MWYKNDQKKKGKAMKYFFILICMILETSR